MKKALSLVLALGMMISILSACGSSDTTSTTDTNGSSDSSASTSSGITGDNVIDATDLVVDLSQEPDGVVPGTSATIASSNDFSSQLLPFTFNGGRYFYDYVYDALFWDENNDGIGGDPLLVDTYTSSEDGLTWVLNLHEDVYFHNGNKLTADSVIGTIDYYIEYDLLSITDDFVSYEATGEYQVTFVISTIGAETPDFMGLTVFDYTSYEEIGYTADAALSAGSGPYEITSYAVGDKIVLTAVEDLWCESRQAHIETVTIEIITNTTTIYNAVAAGDLQYAGLADYSSYELLVGSEAHTIVTTSAEPSIIWMNTDGFCEYLDNAVVRQALIMFIDAEEVMLAATGGYGTLGTNPLNLAFAEYYSYEHPYDPEAALALLEAEGIDPNDIVLEAIVNSAATAPYTNIQSQLSEYGITLNFTGTDQNVVMTAGMAGEWDLWSEHGGLSGVPSYTTPIKNFWSHDAAQVVVTIPEIKDQVADMVVAATSTQDIDEFYGLLTDMCQLIDDNYLYLCSWQGVAWGCFSSEVQNPVINTTAGNWRIYESWLAE